MKSIEIFFCYARKDQQLLENLKLHLMPLQRAKLISMWHDADVTPGTPWEGEIRKHLDTSELILLLVSSDFIASEYCYSTEMLRAMERHRRGEARVIPIILRPVHWQQAPFGKLQVLPTDAIPVTSQKWHDLDEAFYDVTKGIHKAIDELISTSGQTNSASVTFSKEWIDHAIHNRDTQRDANTSPIHLIWIVDCSSSMKGAKIQSLNTTIREAIPQIRYVAKLHPQTQVLARAIAFSTGARWHIAQPTPIENFQWIDVAASGKKDIGEALVEVAEQLDTSTLGELPAPPMLILISDGYLSDSFEFGLRALMAQPLGDKAIRLAVGIGASVDYELLERFIGNPKIKPLQPYNLESLTDYIQWNDEIVEDKLKLKQRLQTVSGITYEVQELIGVGGQGEVYLVTLEGKRMALKWYFPRSATVEQRQALEELVKRGSPNDRFLWPLELVTTRDTSNFGYLMPLRESRYKGLVDLMMRRVSTTFRCLATAGFQLADSYFQLHVSGFCYRDISFGNVFIDPANGETLICNNDNVTVNNTVAGGILGTLRFMAPEIVRSEAFPSTVTDIYSLSVLLFYMFMFHHPLEGKKEQAIRVLNMAAAEKLYGTEPLFIFDPNDHSNEPVKGYQDNALIFWPIYPQFLRDLFTRAFTDGLRDPENGRIRESEWRAAMVRLRDSIFYCSHCDSQNFYDVEAVRKNGGKPNPCWKCKNEVQLPLRLHVDENVIMLNRDTYLYPHHISKGKRYDFGRPVAEVDSNSTNPPTWVLRNLSSEKWFITESKQEVSTGQSVLLKAGTKINFGNREGRIQANL